MTMTHQQAENSLATERYLLDEMTELERSTFEEHYFSCVLCAKDVRVGALMQEGTRAGLAVQPTVQPAANVLQTGKWRPRQVWHFSVAIPWAMAATLAVVAGYESLVLVPQLRRQSGPQALTPIALRPATRGQEPIVSVNSLTGSVTLAVDAQALSPAAELTYDLRTVAGVPVTSGRAPMPPPGMPLLLLIPASAVGAPGHYVLAVKGVTNGDSTAEEYRFEVARQ